MQKAIKGAKKLKKKIFSSVDSLTPIAGLKEKFLAFQQFLRADPSHAKTCKLVQYIEPTDESKFEHLTIYK